ncbi:hypothetical protein DWF04_018175 [Cereibacter sphaeroides f. sp. denitrificans]|nr:hypothetical protein DWF04_03940 [Cereibacter sphaeroides f. sp. denitrificans]
MRFVQVDAGTYISADKVVAITRVRDGKALLSLTDGQEYASSDSFEEVMNEMGDVVPNTTGAQALIVGYDEDDGLEFAVQPIIGWRISEAGADAIGIEDSVVTYILLPDGSIVEPHLAHFRDWDHLKSHLLERQQQSASIPG